VTGRRRNSPRGAGHRHRDRPRGAVAVVETDDDELADAVVNTLDQMISGLKDKVEGGVFRYSVTRDWQTPHYEKMLETNLGFVRNLAYASTNL
jgi:uncharacterized protein YyaL (SSP411 family)